MADKYVFENEDSDDQKAEEEEQTTLAARDTWVSSVLKFPFFFFIVPKSFLTLGLLLSSILHFEPPQPEYSQVGVANSTKTKFKVETYLERVREKTSGGEMMKTKMDS